MSMAKPITIIGGGLAGLTLGVALRAKKIPVLICEAGHYPRHRVCGEFINGKGLAVLQELGLMEGLMQRGAREARNVAQICRRRILQFDLLQLCERYFLRSKLDQAALRV